MISAFSQARISPAVEDALGRAMLVEARGSGHRGTYWRPSPNFERVTPAMAERRKRVQEMSLTGNTPSFIASSLGLTINVVQKHLCTIRKMGAENAK